MYRRCAHYCQTSTMPVCHTCNRQLSEHVQDSDGGMWTPTDVVPDVMDILLIPPTDPMYAQTFTNQWSPLTLADFNMRPSCSIKGPKA